MQFLKELKYSYKNNEKIYTEGSCFRLFIIMELLFDAKPYYSEIEGHWISEVEGFYYDINGRLSEKYVTDKEYKLITDNVTLESAYVPTYEGQSCSYNNYIETI